MQNTRLPKDKSANQKSTLSYCPLKLTPHHLVHHTNVALDDAHKPRGDVFVKVVGHGDARVAVADQRYRHVDALEEAGGVDAAEDETALVQGLGALGRCSDADGGERMPDAREE